MRAYFFGNMYLSSIQQGIQAAHVVAEMLYTYTPANEEVTDDQIHQLYEWAEEHKVMVLLNGGYSSSLAKIEDRFLSKENPFPWASFIESEEALNEALTSVGIILPERIYAMAAKVRCGEVEDLDRLTAFVTEDGETWTYTKWEKELIEDMNKYGLAK